MSIKQPAEAAGVSVNTIMSWFRKLQIVCTTDEIMLLKLTDTYEQPFGFDECYIAYKRKYKDGRLLKRDKRASTETAAADELETQADNQGDCNRW